MSSDNIEPLLAPYGPTLPVPELVARVNLLYHAVEAASYDETHPEIFEQLPQLWSKMVEQALRWLPSRPLQVVDYGCGTGFASAQLLSVLGPKRIGALVCFDPSPEMLDRCRDRFRDLDIPTRFSSSESEWGAGMDAPIDLLLTNSLLHHLPDPIAVVRGLRGRMASSAAWIAGHEPSSRFYGNPDCVALWRRYERERRVKNLFSLGAYTKFVRKRLGMGSDPASMAARQAFEAGLFARPPSAMSIGRLVDLHVAHSPEEAKSGRGLDVEQMEQQLRGHWILRWTRSYAFLGANAESSAPRRWRRRAEKLRRRNPRDGANFCSVWQAG